MFCWEARAAMDRSEAGWGLPAEQRRLDAHVQGCGRCREERGRRERLAGLLMQAGRIDGPLTPAGFELDVLRAARSRARAPRAAEFTPAPRLSWLGPLPAAAAFVVVLAAAILALVGGSPPRGTSGAAMPPLLAEELRDGIAPPAEIAFTIQEDLVGERRGSIPQTTYVLEPAPVENAGSAAVMRASL